MGGADQQMGGFDAEVETPAPVDTLVTVLDAASALRRISQDEAEEDQRPVRRGREAGPAG